MQRYMQLEQYNAPLVRGDGPRIRCPWHGACFIIKTGDIDGFPRLDQLSCIQVSIDEGIVKVQAKKSDLESGKQMNPIANKG